MCNEDYSLSGAFAAACAQAARTSVCFEACILCALCASNVDVDCQKSDSQSYYRLYHNDPPEFESADTCLHRAAQWGHIEVVKYLCEVGSMELIMQFCEVRCDAMCVLVSC